MSFPIGSHYSLNSGSEFYPQNTYPLNTPDQIVNDFFNDKGSLEQFESIISGSEWAQMTDILTYFVATLTGNLIYAVNYEKIKFFCDTILKQSLKLLALKKIHSPEFLQEPNNHMPIRTFLKTFSIAQDYARYHSLFDIGHGHSLSPVAILLYLPNHLIHKLRLDDIENSLKEIVENRDHPLFKFDAQIDYDSWSKLLHFINRGLDISLMFSNQFSIILQEPFFQNIPLYNFYDLHLKPLISGSVTEQNSYLKRMGFSVDIKEDNYDNDKQKFECILSYAQIFKDHSEFKNIKKTFDNLLINIYGSDFDLYIKNSKEDSISKTVDDITLKLSETDNVSDSVIIKLLPLPHFNIQKLNISSTFFSKNFAGRKRKRMIENDSEKRVKYDASSSSSSSSSSYQEHHTPSESTYQNNPTNSLLSKLPSTITKLILSKKPKTAFTREDILEILTYFPNIKKLTVPLEIFSIESSKNLPLNNLEKLIVTTSSEIFNLSDDEFLQKIAILNNLPNNTVEIYFEEDLENFSVSEFCYFINNIVYSWKLILPEEPDFSFWYAFISIFDNINNFNLNNQRQLLDKLSNFNSFHVINIHILEKEIDKVLNHIFSIEYIDYPYLHLFFSKRFLSNPDRLANLINVVLKNKVYIEKYPFTIMGILNGILDRLNSEPPSGYDISDDDMYVDLEEKEIKSLRIHYEEILTRLLDQFQLLYGKDRIQMHSSTDINLLLKLILNSETFNNSKYKYFEFIQNRFKDLDFCVSFNSDNEIGKNFITLLEVIINKKVMLNDSTIQTLLITIIKNFRQYSITKITQVIDETHNENLGNLIKSINYLTFEIIKSSVLDPEVNNFCTYEKYLKLFLKEGYTPPLEECFIKHPRFPFLFMDSIVAALPQLNKLQQDWVAIIVPKLSELPHLSDADQLNYMKLFHFFCVQKNRKVNFPNDKILFNNYPILFEPMLNIYLSNLSKDINFSNLGLQLLSFIFSKPSQEEHAARTTLILLDKLIQQLNQDSTTDLKNQIRTLLLNHKNLEDLFKPAFFISKKGVPNSNLNSFNWIAYALLEKGSTYYSPVVDLLAHAVLEFKWLNIPAQYEEVIYSSLLSIIEKREIKDVSKSVFQLLTKKYKAQVPVYNISKDKIIYDQLIRIAKTIIHYKLTNSGGTFDDSIFLDALEKLSEVDDFTQRVKNNNQSMYNYILMICEFKIINLNTSKLVYYCWKKLLNTDFLTYWNFIFSNELLTKKCTQHLIKQHDNLFYNKNTIQKHILYALRSVPTIHSSLEQLSELRRCYFNELDVTSFFFWGHRFNQNLSTLLGRELTQKESELLKLCSYSLTKKHGTEVISLIKKPEVPILGDLNPVDIYSLLVIFDKINFSDPQEANYCNPNGFKIDNKITPLNDIKGYLNQLIRNILHNEKITASPENPIQRQQFYNEIHNFLKHIVYILQQRKPHDCIGYLVALAEIGSKCATQYQEIPGLLYTLAQETVDSHDFQSIHMLIDTSQLKEAAQLRELKDQLILFLHEQRWNYFRKKLAELPDVLESNIHNYKYIIENVSNHLAIYQGYDSQVKYQDVHVLPEAKKAVSFIKRDFLLEYNILNLMELIKKFLTSKTVELTDWFKKNAPPGKNPEQFLYEIYEEDFSSVKDEWMVYMLEKMEIIDKSTLY